MRVLMELEWVRLVSMLACDKHADVKDRYLPGSRQHP